MRFMKKIILVTMINICVTTFAQQHLSFEYDASGNQKKRELCLNCSSKIKKPIKAQENELLKEEDLISFYPEDNLSYYPNPVNEELFLKWGNTNDIITSKIHLVSLNGQSIKYFNVSESTNSLSIPFQELPSGIYMVVVIYKNGDQKAIKIVKK